jgi:transposase InsO family protein
MKEFDIKRSTFYRNINQENLSRDLEDLKIISSIFEKRKRKVGIRQIKMILERDFSIIMNKKKIARIKIKFGLRTEIRRKNIFKNFAKKKHEHEICKNILNRQFNIQIPDKVYSTDITQLNYGGKKAYLAVFKDLCTKEIVAQNVTNRIDINLTNVALNKALKRLTNKQKEGLMIHSDQGFHFTHFSYRKKLGDNGVIQSMSRKGNCIDNAPVESFFGYIKDHLNLKGCKNLKDIKKEVTKEIYYYNYKRPQVGLKKMPPIEYRRQLIF